MAIESDVQNLGAQPIRTWRGQCVPARHGSDESWEVQARTQYAAAVQLRAQLRADGRVMPADLDWTEV